MKRLTTFHVNLCAGSNSDYKGAIAAGLEARLIRRPGEWSDGAKRSSESEEELTKNGVMVIRSLEELVDEVKGRNVK